MKLISTHSKYAEVWEHNGSAYKLIPVHWVEQPESVDGWWWSQKMAEDEINALIWAAQLTDCYNVLDIGRIETYDYCQHIGTENYTADELVVHNAPLTGFSVEMELAVGTMRTLPVDQDAILQVLCALSMMQERGMVHGDLHTDNILALPDAASYQYRFSTISVRFEKQPYRWVVSDFGHTHFESLRKRSTLYAMYQDVKKLFRFLKSADWYNDEIKSDLRIISEFSRSAAPSPVPAFQMLAILARRWNRIETAPDTELPLYGLKEIQYV